MYDKTCLRVVWKLGSDMLAKLRISTLQVIHPVEISLLTGIHFDIHNFKCIWINVIHLERRIAAYHSSVS
jgi:hypothetical protein